MTYSFVIPSYNPDDNLVRIVEKIIASSDFKIFIIDDGSDIEYQSVFRDLANIRNPRIVLLKHNVNLGKGAALKMVFSHIVAKEPDIKGVVTLDSDGQHSVLDCLRILNELRLNESMFVLGCRQFTMDIPLKSYIGNKISKLIYRVTLGRSFSDTQTGLRGVNREFMERSLSIKSNRFEFETEQLSLAVNSGVQIKEVSIETIYIENNKKSSFRPFVDSFKIYFVLFRYGLTSLATSSIDFLVFMLLMSLGVGVLVSNLIARTVALGFQFSLLSSFVFNEKKKLVKFLFFIVYVYGVGVASAMLQLSLIENDMSSLAAKLLVEMAIFFINFSVLRLCMFTKNKGE